jgi:hypothetical protein
VPRTADSLDACPSRLLSIRQFRAGFDPTPF